MNRKKIYYIFEAYDIKIIKRNNNVLYNIKNYINNRIEKYKTSKYLKIFIMGNKDELEYNEKNIYKNLGIIHLLSISGAYISILIFILNKIVKKKYICIFLLFYIILTNFQISIIRSSICYMLFILNKKYKLDFNSKEIIMVLGSFLLFINPFYLYDIGFLLSFIVSFSLIYFKNLYIDKNYIIKSIIISLISFLSSLPIIINSNYSINLLSILYNIFYIPYSVFILYPLSYITLLYPIFDRVYLFFIFIFENTSLILNKIDILTISISKIPIILIIIYYYFFFSKNKKIILLIFIFYFYNYFSFIPKIYFLDVGQGDCALIRIKTKNYLIDTGGSYNYDYSNNLILFFKSVGVKRINKMFITHGDLDHIGNAYNIKKKFKVDNIYINNYKMTKLEKRLCKDKCNQIGDEDKIDIFYILNPNYDMDDENDNSLVIYFTLNSKNILFMGDTGIEIENRLINDYDLGKIDVLKVGHHGSRTSSSKEFIDEINPKYSVISVGKNNRYGHPNKEVLDNLKDSKIYRTDQDGSIMFKIKNNKLKIETCSP